ncbi:hypothetical protein [Microbacterium kunmingense]|uniref:hypothetical protein n=1 Tax=Microbacterium kunmingense TaxID=2915939 RepID=UPI003D7231DE
MSETSSENDAPAARAIKTAPERRGREILAVVVLSVTAILTAWCGFESSKWGGQMSIQFSQASAARIQAADAASAVRDARAVDLAIYELWIEARATGDVVLADYVEARFTPEFAVAFEDWQSGGEALRSPFAEESYVAPGQTDVEELSRSADEKFAAALVSNQRGDNYALLTVLFALVLFFVAVSERSRTPWSGRFLLGVGVVVAVIGIAILVTFPVLI